MRAFANLALSVSATGLIAGCGGSQFTLGPLTAGGSQVSDRSAGAPNSSGYSLLYNFRDESGKDPVAGVIAVKGALYGTASRGGRFRHGTIYSVSLSGHEKVLYSFRGGSDGAEPFGGLTDVDGTLYGTTYSGGGGTACYAGCGTIFSIAPSGANYRMLYAFTGGDSHGQNPNSTLALLNGRLYGTTAGDGGACAPSIGNCGTVFSVTASGSLTTLYGFSGTPDGQSPTGLTPFKGTLYGTTIFGGKHGLGEVFNITASGDEKTLYSFKGGNDVWYPMATVTPLKGKLYGTGWIGGTATGGRGTIYVVTTAGQESVIFGFNGYDGANPNAPLTTLNGLLYGTTTSGGGDGGGTVFSVTTAGKQTVLHNFGAPHDGMDPLAGLVNLNDTLYGTTFEGGTHVCDKRQHANSCGTVFAVTP